MNRRLTPVTVSFLGCVALLCTAAEEKVAPSLAEIWEKAQKQQLEGKLDIGSTSIEFQKAILTADLSPSDDLAFRLAALQRVCITLLEVLGQKKAAATPTEVERVADATRALLKKIDETIEEDYQFQMGVANISPPAGVPNAAAGMDPNAISDPKLKKLYLESIAKQKGRQNKNTQQLELRRTRQILILHVASLASASPVDGITNGMVIEKFTEDGESRKSLAKIISPTPKGK